jgi:hypothetical protein
VIEAMDITTWQMEADSRWCNGGRITTWQVEAVEQRILDIIG